MGGVNRDSSAGLHLRSVSVLMALLIMAGATVATGKSLYVITDIANVDQIIPVHAYDIAPDGKLTFQAEFLVPFHGAGVIGLALDANTEHLFITYESSNVITLLNPRNLEQIGSTTAPGARNLAGVVYDHHRGLLYCVDRGTPSLYVYEWNADRKELTHAVGSPFTLQGAEGFGIALDEVKDELYVGGLGDKIGVYGTSDWRLLRTIAVDRIPISVAVDPVKGFLYYGGGYADNFYLTQYNLANKKKQEIEIAPDAGVIGVAVDPMTGFVYVSTGRNNTGGGDDLLVFDSGLILQHTVQRIGNPTGVVVPAGPISYNPLNLTKTIKTLDGEKTSGKAPVQVTIGEELTYSICFDHGNLYLSGISLVDKLPAEVTFVQATGDGVFGHYDAQTHTYTWQNPPLSQGGRTCLELTGLLDSNTLPGKTIANWVTLDTRETPPTTTEIQAIAVEPASFKPLHVRKTVVIGGAEVGEATSPIYVNAGDEVTYRISFDNRDNESVVRNVIVTDALPQQVDFVRATGDGTFGQYDPVTHDYTWLYPWAAPGESNSVDLVVLVDRDLIPGARISNAVAVAADDTPTASASADVTVAEFATLRLRKSIAAGAGDLDDRGRPLVDAGGLITYAICFDNPSTDKTATQITIIDTLPREMDFISADGDHDFGLYDPNTHTYTWRYPSLDPFQERCMRLNVRVNEQTEPNTVISNSATIETVQMPPVRARLDVVVSARPVKGTMYMRPTHIWRNNSKATPDLMVIVHLPPGYGRELIMNTPLVLTPGDVIATGQTIYGDGRQGKVLCFFDTAPILAATKGYGEFPVTVTGKLYGGRSFIGEGTVTVLKFGGP